MIRTLSIQGHSNWYWCDIFKWLGRLNAKIITKWRKINTFIVYMHNLEAALNSLEEGSLSLEQKNFAQKKVTVIVEWCRLKKNHQIRTCCTSLQSKTHFLKKCVVSVSRSGHLIYGVLGNGFLLEFQVYWWEIYVPFNYTSWSVWPFFHHICLSLIAALKNKMETNLKSV